MLTFYHGVHTRSSTVLWMLEETGQPYDLKILDLKAGEHRQAPYITDINPMGKVPAIVHNGVAISEAGAICTYLADAFPEAKLAIPVGDMRRGPYLKWIFFNIGCIEPALIDKLLDRPDVKRELAGWGTHELVVDVLAKALEKGPFILGETFTAADVVIGSALRWAMMFKGIPERKEFMTYVARLKERPALQRAVAKDAELAARQAA